ncbi:MAG: hypothetical protein ISQ91_01780 [Candidatus Pelagibacter bacterium]|nr:hypothetical protein [Candidatus Pelagibacter bacterium]
MKKILLIVILLFLTFSNAAISKEIQAYCLISAADIEKARLDPKENERFAGKTIKLLLSFAENSEEKNLIIDNSEDNVVGLITGLYGGVKDVQTFEIVSNGIRYSSTYNAKNTTYDYNNVLRMPNNKPTTLDAKVDVKGFSMTKFRFEIDCQNKEYTAEEISFAKDPNNSAFELFGIKNSDQMDQFFKKAQEKLKDKKK